MTYAAVSEPREAPVRHWYCANCGALMIAAHESLPDVCTSCHDLTTWRTSKPRNRIPWRETVGPIVMHEPPVAGVRVYDVGWLSRVDASNEDCMQEVDNPEERE